MMFRSKSAPNKLFWFQNRSCSVCMLFVCGNPHRTQHFNRFPSQVFRPAMPTPANRWLSFPILGMSWLFLFLWVRFPTLCFGKPKQETYWCNSRTFWRNLPNQSRRQSTPNTLDGCRKAVADLNFRGKRSQGLVSSSIPHRKVQWNLISNLFCCNERGISVPEI